MKIISIIFGLFILYVQYHYVFVDNIPADFLTYILTAVGILLVLLPLTKTRPLS